MSPTVNELRNDVRTAVGRYERVEKTSFTKEELQAVAVALGYLSESSTRPSKAQMRAGIRWRIGERGDDDPDGGRNAFTKSELRAILAKLDDSAGGSE